MKKNPSSLPCPESWVDPEIIPLVTLLNRLGFETVWSCAGFGVSRSGVEPPISRIPAKTRKLIRFDGETYHIEEKGHQILSSPYVVFRLPDAMPVWFAGVLRYLSMTRIGGNDLYTDRFSDYVDEPLVVAGEWKREGEMDISMAKGACSIISRISEVPICRNDIITIKRMWLHEMTKAFSFI